MLRYDISQLKFESGTVFKITDPKDSDHNQLFLSHGFFAGLGLGVTNLEDELHTVCVVPLEKIPRPGLYRSVLRLSQWNIDVVPGTSYVFRGKQALALTHLRGSVSVLCEAAELDGLQMAYDSSRNPFRDIGISGLLSEGTISYSHFLSCSLYPSEVFSQAEYYPFLDGASLRVAVRLSCFDLSRLGILSESSQFEAHTSVLTPEAAQRAYDLLRPYDIHLNSLSLVGHSPLQGTLSFHPPCTPVSRLLQGRLLVPGTSDTEQVFPSLTHAYQAVCVLYEQVQTSVHR